MFQSKLRSQYFNLYNYWRFFDLMTTLLAAAGLLVAIVDYEVHYTYDQSDENDPRKIKLAKNSPLRVVLLILTILAITTILLRHAIFFNGIVQVLFSLVAGGCHDGLMVFNGDGFQNQSANIRGP